MFSESNDMKKIGLYVYCLALFSMLCPGTTALRGKGASLDEVLSQMDAAGAKLNSMRAEIRQKKWTAILEEFDEGERGHFFFLKTDDGVCLRKDIEEPTSNTLIIKEGQVTFYQPSIKQAQRWHLGRHEDKAEFMLLGFGSNKQALSDTYDSRLLGQETLGEHNTYQLELRPKSKDVAAIFVRILLWIDDQMWVPVQEQLVEPTEDYLLIRFNAIELGPKLSKSDFEMNFPKDVKIIQN